MNIKKILLINVVLIAVIFAVVEIFSYHFLFNRYKDVIENYNVIQSRNNSSIIKKPALKYVKVTLPKKEELISFKRPIEYRNSSKKPIVLIGCSFTEGFGLNEDETFSRKLADYTDRTVYNRGRSGTGLPYLYYQLSDNEILSQMPKNTEYIIYTLIPDHFPRMFRYRNFVMSGDHTLRYKIKNGKLVQDRILFPALHSLNTAIVIEEFLANKRCEYKDNTKNLFHKIIAESDKIIKQYFDNAKLVILYIKNPLDNDIHEYDEIINELKNIDSNIEIIYINDLIPELYDRENWIEDNDHPSGKAWDKIVPVLCKKLGIS